MRGWGWGLFGVFRAWEGLCGTVLCLVGKGFGLRRGGFGGLVLGFGGGTGWAYEVGWWVFGVGGLC